MFIEDFPCHRLLSPRKISFGGKWERDEKSFWHFLVSECLVSLRTLDGRASEHLGVFREENQTAGRLSDL